MISINSNINTAPATGNRCGGLIQLLFSYESFCFVVVDKLGFAILGPC